MVTKRKNRSKASSRGKTTAKRPLPSPSALPASGNGSSPSNLDMLRRMYSAMLKCRMMEERARDGNAVLAYDLAAGHEAIVIGASIDLKPERYHCRFPIATSLLMSPWGTPLKYLLKKSGANISDESGASILSCRFALPGPISSAAFLADPFNLATGLALSHKLEKKKLTWWSLSGTKMRLRSRPATRP